MKPYKTSFMGEEAASSFDSSNIVVLPFPYEGGISYGKGASGAPDTILDASAYVELYDEIIGIESYQAGIFTAAPPEMPNTPEKVMDKLHEYITGLLEKDKFPIVVGGDHSISSAFAKALKDHYGKLSVIQFDAHADLRDTYEGSKYSHACVMARIREITTDTLQIGIRSLSAEEARLIDEETLHVCMMKDLDDNIEAIESSITKLSSPVFITFDVDVFDWSVIRSTGTPEPGGMSWNQVMAVLEIISRSKHVAGFDIVELSEDWNDKNSAFAAAKLAYRMIGLFAQGKKGY